MDNKASRAETILTYAACISGVVLVLVVLLSGLSNGERMRKDEAAKLTNQTLEQREKEREQEVLNRTQQTELARQDFRDNLEAYLEKNVYEKIREYAKDGRHAYEFSFRGDDREFKYGLVAEALQKDGYAIIRGQDQFVEGGYTNMGDTEAPCSVWSDSYWWFMVSVKW